MRFALVAMLVVGTTWAVAQSTNEAGLLLGATRIPAQAIVNGSVASGNRLSFGTGMGFQATYARRLRRGDRIGLQLEVPFLGVPNNDIRSGDPSPPTALASIFITPGLRVRFAPDARFSPWLSAGGGVALFDEGARLAGGGDNPGPKGTTTGAAQFGGGVDLRVLRRIGLRGELRDFYSGRPKYNVTTGSDRQHNLAVSFGFVVHF